MWTGKKKCFKLQFRKPKYWWNLLGQAASMEGVKSILPGPLTLFFYSELQHLWVLCLQCRYDHSDESNHIMSHTPAHPISGFSETSSHSLVYYRTPWHLVINKMPFWYMFVMFCFISKPTWFLSNQLCHLDWFNWANYLLTIIKWNYYNFPLQFKHVIWSSKSTANVET